MAAPTRRLRAVAGALQSGSPAVAAEPVVGTPGTLIGASIAALAAVAYSYQTWGIPRHPKAAVPVPGSEEEAELAAETAAAESAEAAVEAAVEEAEALSGLVGGPVEAVDTPALLIDLEALEHNIRTYAATLEGRNCVWRPHCKAIRSPELAHMLVDAGAVGVTCAKLSQAQVLVVRRRPPLLPRLRALTLTLAAVTQDGGIKDVLVANEVVGATKIAALISLAEQADAVCVAVDDEGVLRDTAAAAVDAGVTIHVLVDVNVGMNRCGIHWERLDAVRPAPSVSWATALSSGAAERLGRPLRSAAAAPAAAMLVAQRF